jgi:hypothetical protein
MRRIVSLILFIFTSLVIFSQSVAKEANLKAAFIYNFTKYIEWNNDAVSGDFVIGIIGNSSVSNSLLQIAKTQTAKNKRIVIRLYTNPEEIGGCNILFIAKDNSFSLASILERTGRGVLTISEEPGFASQGTILNFISSNGKLKFEANLKALYDAGLSASSQLLKLAIIVDN